MSKPVGRGGEEWGGGISFKLIGRHSISRRIGAIFHFVNAVRNHISWLRVMACDPYMAWNIRGRCPTRFAATIWAKRFGGRDRLSFPRRNMRVIRVARISSVPPAAVERRTKETNESYTPTKGRSPRLATQSDPARYSRGGRASPDTYVGTISANLYANSPCSSRLTCCSS